MLQSGTHMGPQRRDGCVSVHNLLKNLLTLELTYGRAHYSDSWAINDDLYLA